MSDAHNFGLPGVGLEKTAGYKRAVLQDIQYLSGGAVVDGALVYSAGGDDDLVEAGTLMLRNATSGKYAPLAVGVSAGAIASADTTLTVGSDAAQYAAKLLAAGITALQVYGADAGAAVNAAVTIDSVDVGAGTITLTGAVGQDFDAGASAVQAFDATAAIAIVEAQAGFLVTDEDNNRIDVSWPDAVIGAWVDASQVPGMPADKVAAAGFVAAIHAAGNDLKFDTNYVG